MSLSQCTMPLKITERTVARLQKVILNILSKEINSITSLN